MENTYESLPPECLYSLFRPEEALLSFLKQAMEANNIWATLKLKKNLTGPEGELLEWAQSHKYEDIGKILEIALINKDIAILEWGIINQYPISNIVKLATQHGQTDVLDWVLATGYKMNAHDIFKTAAQFGQTEVLKWIEYQLSSSKRKMFTCILKKYRRMPNFWENEGWFTAIEHGRLEVLEWGFARKHLDFEHEFCHKAAEFGKLSILQWLRTKGCPWDYYVYIVAVKGNHDNILDWAYKNGCELDPEMTCEEISNLSGAGILDRRYFDAFLWVHEHCECECSWYAG